jgi:D-serine deaminase-like pyridoxal phosphate-dependent protein
VDTFVNFEDINTPAVLIDRDIAERNIHRFQEYCSQKGLALRPHIKTHKIAELAKIQVGAGAVGINCQKLSEAEVMASHGLEDILITYNIIGEQKLSRLMSLASKVRALAVTADSSYTVKGLSSAFAKAAKPLEVLVECDTGGRRCGVQTPEEAVELAKFISQSPGLVLGGLMTYPARGGTKDVQVFMDKTVGLLRSVGFICKTITSGGSPDMWHAHEAPIVNEYRVGTYIYNDRSLVAAKTCDWEDCALSVLTTVVSTPATGRAIVDAGSKALSSDLMGLEGHGGVVEHPQIQIAGLSEEHGHLRYPATLEPLRVGQRLRIIPNHACTVSNLFEEVVFIRKGQVEKVVKVDARGCST